MLTKKQYDLLMLINDKIKKDGVPPSFDEMKDTVGLKSKSGICSIIDHLEERGFIRRIAHKARAIEVLRLPSNIDDSAVQVGTPVKNTGLKEIPAANYNPNNFEEIPLYGKIAAGTPIEALRDENELIAVPQSMLGMGEHYALKVEGDSMIDAGILDGDTVIIQRTNTSENGAIVVALVDGYEVTLKKLFCRKGKVELEPANRNYETRVLPPERVAVQGRLVGLMRNY